MAKYIKRKKGSNEIDAKHHEFIELTNLVRSLVKSTQKKTKYSVNEGEILVEFIRALTRESTKSIRPDFASRMGLTDSGLSSVLYQRNITGRHLANFLLILTNSTVEEFISEFFMHLFEKSKREKPPEWLKVMLQIENLTDEEMRYIALMGLKFDSMIKDRKK